MKVKFGKPKAAIETLLYAKKLSAAEFFSIEILSRKKFKRERNLNGIEIFRTIKNFFEKLKIEMKKKFEIVENSVENFFYC